MSAGGTSLRTLSEERRPSGRGKGGKGLGRGRRLPLVVQRIKFNDYNEKFIRDELYSRRHILGDDVDVCLFKMRTELNLDSSSYYHRRLEGSRNLRSRLRAGAMYQAVSILMRRLSGDPEWLRK